MKAQPLAWTPEQIERFWAYWERRPRQHAGRNSSRTTKGVCKFLEQISSLADQRILDYAAGPGFMIGDLLQRGAYVSAVEASESMVTGLNRRFHRDRFWSDARLLDGRGRIPWADNSFDLVCCLSTLEHLSSNDVHTVLSELFRVLKPGGAVLFSTPNEENLHADTVFCPECCGEFHRWQHVRRWSADSLREQLTRHQYEIRYCGGLDFLDFQLRRLSIADLVSPGFWLGIARTGVLAALDHLRPRPFPHGRRLKRRLGRDRTADLVAVGLKPDSESVAKPQAASAA